MLPLASPETDTHLMVFSSKLKSKSVALKDVRVVPWHIMYLHVACGFSEANLFSVLIIILVVSAESQSKASQLSVAEE